MGRTRGEPNEIKRIMIKKNAHLKNTTALLRDQAVPTTTATTKEVATPAATTTAGTATATTRAAAGSCTDVAGWVDSDGDGCPAYTSCVGGGWKDYSDVYYAEWAVDGVSGRQACCVTVRGRRDPGAGDDDCCGRGDGRVPGGQAPRQALRRRQRRC